MLDKLQEIIRKYADDETIEITTDTVLLTDIGFNSYELVQLVVEVEEAFGVEIPDRQIGKLVTVGDVVDYLEGV